MYTLYQRCLPLYQNVYTISKCLPLYQNVYTISKCLPLYQNMRPLSKCLHSINICSLNNLHLICSGFFLRSEFYDVLDLYSLSKVSNRPLMKIIKAQNVIYLSARWYWNFPVLFNVLYLYIFCFPHSPVHCFRILPVCCFPYLPMHSPTTIFGHS